eukprot:3367022-Ditylum_brightwellii.AAC.1
MLLLTPPVATTPRAVRHGPGPLLPHGQTLPVRGPSGGPSGLPPGGPPGHLGLLLLLPLPSAPGPPSQKPLVFAETLVRYATAKAIDYNTSEGLEHWMYLT